MSDSPRSRRPTALPAAILPSGDQVRAFLRLNPNYLNEHPELVEVLLPPRQHRGNDVVDLQQFLVERLQDRVRDLKARQNALIAVSRGNHAAQAQVHAATLALLEPTSFEHLIHVATRDLVDVLNVDIVALCVEEREKGAARDAGVRGVHILEAGQVDRLIGEGQQVRLGQVGRAERALYGPAARLVNSCALVRLDAGRRVPNGLLALGSRDKIRFEARHGTELLLFLGQVLAQRIRALLHLPA